MVSRAIIEDVQKQGVDEEIVYTITTTPWGSSPTSPSAVVKDLSDDSDVTSTVMPAGSASAAGDVITLPVLKALTDGSRYRVEIKFSVSGNILECWFEVRGER